jgi:hypothetical protein
MEDYKLNKFVNSEKFEKWLKDNYKHNLTQQTISVFYDELQRQQAETGMSMFEMSSTQTKSGNPETISYDYNFVLDENKDCKEETFEF